MMPKHGMDAVRTWHGYGGNMDLHMRMKYWIPVQKVYIVHSEVFMYPGRPL